MGRNLRLLPVVLLLACGDGGGDAETESGTVPAAGGGPAVAPAASNAGDVPLTVSVSSGSERHEQVGSGKCRHAPSASIYGVPASLWQVQYSSVSDVRHISLSVWRPAAGGVDQFSLNASTTDEEHTIATVEGGERVGSGSITMHPQGEGARFEIDGIDGAGAPVRATVQCTKFTALVAEGG